MNKNNTNYQSFSKLLIPSSIKTIVFIFAYVFLLAPPRAGLIEKNARQNNTELSGKPFIVIFFAEIVLRLGFFLLAAAAIEEMMGNVLFELLKIDYLYGLMMIFGLLHMLAFYAAKLLYQHNQTLACLLYRLGRNTSYALVPALLITFISLYFQYMQQIPFFTGEVVQNSFIISLCIALVAGTLQAIIYRLKHCQL
jgi:hypothetical protein